MHKRFLLCLALLVAGCRKEQPGPSAATGPVHVTVTKVVSGKLSRSLRLTGELQAYRDVAIYAKVAGFVDSIPVDRGSRVGKGELLLKLVAPEISAQKREAEAKLAADEATFNRLTEAHKTPGAVADQELLVAEKNAEADRERVRLYAQNEAYLTITAPFEGIVTERNVHEGSYAGPPGGAGAVPLVRIQEVASLRLVAYVPEHAAGSVGSSGTIDFTVSAFPGEVFHGTLARAAHALDAKTRTMSVELDVENKALRLSPGMFAEVRWPMTRPAASLFVPASAVARTTERTFVVRVRDKKVEWVDVKPGAPMGDRLEVFGDLSEGDLVAVRGTDELRLGMEVQPAEAPPKQ